MSVIERGYGYLRASNLGFSLLIETKAGLTSNSITFEHPLQTPKAPARTLWRIIHHAKSSVQAREDLGPNLHGSNPRPVYCIPKGMVTQQDLQRVHDKSRV